MDTSLFKGLLQKKWFIALLVLALIVESSLLLIILVESYLGNQSFPQISIIRYAEPQCATLTATTIATGRSNSTGAYQNRTVEFSCSGNYALKIFPLDTLTCFLCRDPQYFPLVPIFTLPRGYLTLSLTCPVNCLAGQMIPLKNGNTVYLSSWGGYDYIAVLNGSSVGASGFTVSWRNGVYSHTVNPPVPYIGVSASPTNFTFTAGQSVITTVTVTSVNKFNGAVSLGYDIANLLPGGYSGSGGPTVAFNQSKVLLTAVPGSNSTTATVKTGTTIPKGLYIIDVWAQIPNSIFSVNLYVTVT